VRNLKTTRGTRMKELGRVQMSLWLSTEQHNWIMARSKELRSSAAELIRLLMQAGHDIPELCTRHGQDGVRRAVRQAQGGRPAKK
jgi:hypothetical protein